MDYARRLRGQCHALGHGLVRSRLFNRPWLLADLSIKAGLAAQAVGLWPAMKGPNEKWREAMAAICNPGQLDAIQHRLPGSS